MLQDKYSGNSKFIQKFQSHENSVIESKLDQIHKLIHNAYEEKKNNINQSKQIPQGNVDSSIQQNEVVNLNTGKPSEIQMIVEHDYVKKFEEQQKALPKHEPLKNDNSIKQPQGYQAQEIPQAKTDFTPLQDTKFEKVQQQKQQGRQHSHQQQREEMLKISHKNMPTLNPNKGASPFEKNISNYAAFENQQSQQKGERLRRQQSETNKQKITKDEVLTKQKKDDLNILIILVIFALIFIF